MRVISGKYKGRHFDIPKNFKARPTTDFAKENLFNILCNIIDFDEETLEEGSIECPECGELLEFSLEDEDEE